jgi:pyrimidine-nucleoside phosphorylase
MRMVDLIEKKKDGLELSSEEIEFAVQGYVKGEIPDYQMSAMLMAIYFRGMSRKETADLTTAYVNSGDRIDLSGIKGIKVDKHSSGGVGDKISLIVIPLMAMLGIPVAKMSGRGLGHTGGTIDKLESIPGFKTELSPKVFIDNVNLYKMAIVSQSSNLTPGDKKTYALRDVTATVDSIPLIASSIMSKKIASGADAIVLDVKVGSGAFMKSLEKARELAEAMVRIGKDTGIKTVAVITNMDQPLGHEVGNFNEVLEAVEVLKGKGDQDEVTVALSIAAHMAVLGGAFDTFEAAHAKLKRILDSGAAVEKFAEFIEIQGGDPSFIKSGEAIYRSKHDVEVKSDSEGYVKSIMAELIGRGAMLLGAGRKKKEDAIDYAAGITLVKKTGDKVGIGDTLCILHTNLDDWTEAAETVKSAYKVDKDAPEKIKYIYDVVR